MLLIALTCTSVALGASIWQTSKDPAHQLDFWLGNWNCVGEMHAQSGKSTKTVAHNSITREMDGHLIHEHFKMEGFKGESFSVYSPVQKIWHQTWVDDSGGYLAFSGRFSDGKMTLAMAPDSTGAIKRMVFSNISKDAFDWDWMVTKDGGKTWSVRWHLHYTRASR